MKVIITGRKMNVSPGLKSVIEEKLQKIKYFYDHVISFHIILEKEKLDYKAEINFRADGRRFFLQEVAGSMHEAIDNLIDKLERQVRKHKDRMKEHKHRRKEVQGDASLSTTDSFQVGKVDSTFRSELEVALQLAISENDFEFFIEEEGDKFTTLAVKDEENLFTVLTKDKESGRWYLKHLYLDGEHIAQSSIEDFHAQVCSVPQAMSEFAKGESPVFVFQNRDDGKLQGLYRRDDKELFEIMTLGD